MDFSHQIVAALQEGLDIPTAFPVVFSMNQATVDIFVQALYQKLHERILKTMEADGEKYVAEDDALGLSLLLMRDGVKLPSDMLLTISKDIIRFSRKTARWITHTGNGIPGQDGGLWYLKMYINLTQDETA